MSSKFIKNQEDFVCQNCGESVFGDGCTNHCPKCLWSKHVDVNPGDRAESCGGLMKPIGVEKKSEKYRVTHQCQKCGYEKTNSVSETDNFDEVISIVKSSV
jgi:hypothetical protein